MENEWIKVDYNNPPQENVIFQWKHPEYPIVTGSLVWYGGKRLSEQAWWVFPDGGQEADIWLGEFTHYRRLNKKTNLLTPLAG